MLCSERVPGTPGIAVTRLGHGPVVLFLHGIGGHRGNWDLAVREVAEAGFTAIAWDARGYGDSDDYEGPLRFRDLSSDLLRLLDHFGAQHAHLVGLSMGGRIIQDFYYRHPARVRSLSLCDTTPGFDAFSEAEKRDYVARRSEPLLAGASPADIADGVIDKLRGPGATDSVLAHLRDSVSRLRAANYLKAVEATVEQRDIGRLEEIDVPVMVLVGEHDRLTTPDVARGMASRIPGARFVLIPGAGHLSNLENPRAFVDALLAFLRAH